MAKKKKRKVSEGCATDMTPMIDVVFQLIIFFIVTLKMDENNPDIKLDDAPYGPMLKEVSEMTTVIEVDRKGRITMHNVPFAKNALSNYLRSKYKKYGEFPILIRGDYRAQHKDIRGVMDTCTAAGLWRINFAAIKERKT